ncbi:choice-of-anchor B family protein [Cryomorpha ignava]|uniref:Choice-of-anchor B family protein n=1 Tax=Cryomorpha ignava TaxID=101383 RepID=A0A7K3WUE4_9FLAO|nr:choice-of-anchor B family protein [Cryomorpha ignava]NEN24661.1 choice-of-anchor B family protein [Cryomorpha ignava]
MFRFYTCILFSISIFFSLNVLAQPCIDGFAGQYPCDKVDQLAMIPLDDFFADNANDIWGWTSTVTGREYVLLGLENKTAFIDITTPQYPIYLGFLPTATVGSLWRDVKVIDQYAYIVSEANQHGIQVFDLTRLENLTAEGLPRVFDEDAYYGGFGHAHNVIADTANKFIYGVGTSTFNGGLHIVDVSDPLNPQYAGSNAMGGYVHDAQVRTYTGPDENYTGEEIAVGFNADRIVVYNVTDKTDVEIISQTTYEDVGYTHQGWFTEDMRYLLSNDETDELDFGMNTRTIIWDMADLENPQVISYVDLQNTSIDHNLYIDNDMVYESNYTNGLRILDLLEVETGHLEDFGFFDVVPFTDAAQFIGTWSNYPYFESGVVPVSGMFTGLHLVKPQFYALQTNVVKVCGESTANLPISVNRRLFGSVTYTVEMEGVAGLSPVLEFSETEGAPSENIITWAGLDVLNPGYYPGVVFISNNGREERLPFVLVKDVEPATAVAPAPVSPSFELLPNQDVTFTFTDNQPGMVTLQVALDADFDEIVYAENFYDSSNSVQAFMPFDLSTYFWRLVKPTACGDDLISDAAAFTIDIASSVSEASAKANFTIYPNPASDVVYIENGEKSRSDFRVFDIAGKEVAHWTGSGSKSFSIAHLEKGIYIVKSSGSAVGVKLVKN